MLNQTFHLDALEQARKHSLVAETPAPGFQQGALLGNGGMGVVICTRPDAVTIHFAHNNVWDVRIHEPEMSTIGTFEDVFNRLSAILNSDERLDQDPWFNDYRKSVYAGYAREYPRPFPCGQLILGFDRRRMELIGHELDISSGVCRVKFLMDGSYVFLEMFADMDSDRLWMRSTDVEGCPARVEFNRVRLLPARAEGLPDFVLPDKLPEDSLSFMQVLPAYDAQAQDQEKLRQDRAFRLTVRLKDEMSKGSRVNWFGCSEETGELESLLSPSDSFLACVQLEEGYASDVPLEPVSPPDPTEASSMDARRRSDLIWREFWDKSGVALADEFLESIWYRNLYFLNCSLKPGVTCPGLYGNFLCASIGKKWHGDYHFDYNVQQPFWTVFSSNHVDKHLPYVDLIDHLLPVSRKWAAEYYGLKGACFPLIAYPVEMSVNPYPLPTLGLMISPTPWAVQSLWWHYLYTMDVDFLRERAFGPIREAVLFLTYYMSRPEAHGERWGDDRYHVFPTVAPELFGLSKGWKLNYDSLADLTLIRFVFNAYLNACRELDIEEAESALIYKVKETLAHFPEYPVAETELGTAFAPVPGATADLVQNAPVTTMPVFPGEEYGLHSSDSDFQIAVNTYRVQQNEGGNDLVFLNLQTARLGLLDLEKFKRQVRYCMMPNGTCSNRLLQVGGRYDDTTDFEFLTRLGVLFENCALPVVVNECLLQSYNGTIRLFPNWPRNVDAEFRTLRAVGAFLVSASLRGGEVKSVEVVSEAGARLRLILPWENGAVITHGESESHSPAGMLEMDTVPGQVIKLSNIQELEEV